MSLPDTFWAKTTRTDCIVWTGAVNGKGYPCFAVAGRSQLAHRLAWEDARGPIPEDMTIDHTCRVRNCVNVDHLELVSGAENNRRARVSAGYFVGGQCGRGHDLTDESTKTSKRGRLICKPCAQEDSRAARRRDNSVAVIREWAMENGLPIGIRGRVSQEIREAYEAAAS